MSQLHQVLLNNVSANGAGAVVRPQNFPFVEYGLLQVDMDGTATVTLQGRVSPQMSWFDVAVVTTSQAVRVSLVPEMQAVVSNYVSGVVRAEITG